MSTQNPVHGSFHGLSNGHSHVYDLFRSAADLTGKAIDHAFDKLATWRQRAQERHQLRMLDDHMLHDVGLTRADVEAEASKPFWTS